VPVERVPSHTLTHHHTYSIFSIPISWQNSNSGHMIKFQLFDTANSYQCHFAEISTFVVSIAHYMRAYFNYRALKEGKDFSLPQDAAFLNVRLFFHLALTVPVLNFVQTFDVQHGVDIATSLTLDIVSLQCVPLSVNGDYTSLYGKIGCMERETFTSTKLQLHLYTDQQCSQPYQDGSSARRHAKKGYNIGGSTWISSKVSFKPDFYSCLTCAPDQIAETYNKMNGNWYDDDYISQYGSKQGNSNQNKNVNNNDDGAANGDDAANATDDAVVVTVDDQYFTAADDNYQAAANGDDAYKNKNYNYGYYNSYNQGDDNYNGNDDGYSGRRRQLYLPSTMVAAKQVLEVCYPHHSFEFVHSSCIIYSLYPYE
jgi:hypothetical protein